MYWRCWRIANEDKFGMTDTDLLKRYLLGGLSEDEQTLIENECFTDVERLEELEAVENDLIDSYAHGGLLDSERQLFRLKYLNSPEQRSRVEFAHAFKKIAGRTERTIPEPKSRMWPLGMLFAGLYERPRTAFAAAAFLLVVVCGVSLFLQNRKLRAELHREQMALAELQRRHDISTQQLAALTKQAAEAASKTDGGTELAKVEPPELPGEPLTLTTGMLRGGEQDVRTLLLPLHRPSFRLQLVLPQNGRERETLDATIQTAEAHQPFFVEAGLSPVKGSAGRTVILRVPSKLIHAGYYSVSLYKGGTDLSGDPIDSYVFRAR
jgi:hypothetical protein